MPQNLNVLPGRPPIQTCLDEQDTWAMAKAWVHWFNTIHNKIMKTPDWIEDTHAKRANYPAANDLSTPVSYSPNWTANVEHGLYYETDRNVFYKSVLVSNNPAWVYFTGVMLAALTARPTDLGANDKGFLFFDTGAFTMYYWDGTTWHAVSPQTPWASDVDAAGHNLKNAGEIGIGTVPQYLLDVRGASTGTTQVHIGYDGTDAGGYLSVGSSSGVMSVSGGLAVNTPGTWTAKNTNWGLSQIGNDIFRVFLGTGATVGAAVTLATPTIYAIGPNVGIDNASPAYPLDVSGASAVATQMHISYDGSDTGAYLGVGSGQNFNVSCGVAIVGGAYTAKMANWSLMVAGQNSWSVYVGAGATVGSPVSPGTPTIYAYGPTVGINNTSPTATLDINGNLRVSGLPSTYPGAGTKQLWYDPADSNRVKFAV